MGHNSSYIELPDSKFQRSLYKIYFWISILTNPIWWILDKKTKTILDVGCGPGYPMELLKKVKPNLEATGVDLFDEYLKRAKKLGVYNKLIKSDVRKLPFKEREFDTVICLQVIEHLSKRQGLELLKNLERIAKYQVILTTSFGFFEHPDVDENKLQRHLSGWEDDDFRKRGYKTKHQGLTLLFGNDGLVHKRIPIPFKVAMFILDKILMPFYLLIPGFADYLIISYKKINH